MLYLTAPEELEREFQGEPRYRVDQLRSWLYDNPVTTVDAMANLPLGLREELREKHWPFELEVEQRSDAGTTRKWLLRMPDGVAIETVVMGYPRRVTVCISSQAGCALACTFCATGQFGFDRHLEAGEIVAQVAFARAQLRLDPLPGSPNRVTNVVFMGMGEPLANYKRVRESLRRMIDVMNISARNVTVSTVGVVPGIRRLAEEPWQVRLAVSLHAADDDLRGRLVPLNKRYPLAEIESAAAEYFRRKRRRISIEWTMIDGVNDGLEQARKLSPIANRLGAHVNLIALNPTPLTDDEASSTSSIHAFARTLADNGVTVTIRDTRGKGIDAGCGQLRVVHTP